MRQILTFQHKLYPYSTFLFFENYGLIKKLNFQRVNNIILLQLFTHFCLYIIYMI